MAHPDDVLEYWFGDALSSPTAARDRNAFWFGADAEVDGEIWRLFADALTDAANGHYDDWADTARGRLALIILLDQFPRHIFRGTAEAYRYDPLALNQAQTGVAIDQPASLSVPEQAFFLLPYQHAENRDVQRTGVALYQAMAMDAEQDWAALARGYSDFAVVHRDIIERYGRFPHRNELLGRRSSAAESRFLAAGGERFGQQGQF